MIFGGECDEEDSDETGLCKAKCRNKPLEAAVSREAIRLTDASAAATETRIETRMSNRDSDGDSDKARVPTMSRRCRRSGTEP